MYTKLASLMKNIKVDIALGDWNATPDRQPPRPEDNYDFNIEKRILEVTKGLREWPNKDYTFHHTNQGSKSRID